MRNILTVANKELHDDLRSRWTIGLSLVFVVLALSIIYFGGVAAGKVGYTSFGAILASLTTLAAFVIPLMGLLIAYDTAVGEREAGTLLLLLSYPLAPAELLTGKLLGHSATLAVAIVAGFGLACGFGQFFTPAARSVAIWSDIGGFMASASLLGASFVGIGCLISVMSHEKARAAGLALVAWFLLVILFDLVLLAVLVTSGGNAIERVLFPYLLLLNPIDVFRLVNLVGLHGAGNTLFLSMTAGEAYPSAVLWAVAAVWAALPFSLALIAFRKQEL